MLFVVIPRNQIADSGIDSELLAIAPGPALLLLPGVIVDDMKNPSEEPLTAPTMTASKTMLI